MEEGHYTRQSLNDEMSRKFLKTYLELLDFSHLFFTQQDVDALTAKHGASIDDDVLLGNLKPAYEIYDLYQKRVDERVAKIKELLKQPIDFAGDATIDLSRQKASCHSERCFRARTLASIARCWAALVVTVATTCRP